MHLHTPSHLTLCDSMCGSPLGSSVHGILQARTLECVAISFFKASSQPRVEPPGGLVSKLCLTLVTPCTAACQALLSVGFSGKNTGVSCNFLLQGIFLIQESNLHSCIAGRFFPTEIWGKPLEPPGKPNESEPSTSVLKGETDLYIYAWLVLGAQVNLPDSIGHKQGFASPFESLVLVFWNIR